MKKIRKLFILLLAGLFLFSSCIKDAEDDELIEETETETENVSNSSADEKDIYINLTEKKTSDDNSTWFDISSIKTKLLGKTVKITSDDYGVITLDYTSERAYDTNIHLSGSLTGGVKIQTNGEEGVNTAVYLNNVTITSTDYPCLEITKGGAATVYLSGSNTFTDGRIYGYGYGDSAATCESSRVKNAEGSDNKGTLYCKGSLTIAESSSGGALTVIQAYKNCIATKDGLLTVKSGSLNLKNYHGENSGKNGLYGGTGIVIEGGSISFEGKGVVSPSDLRKANGLKTDDQDGTNTTNYINISGGSISISIEDGKGISASNVNISGGSVKVLVSGEENDSQTSYSCYDADGVQESGTIKYNPKGIEGEEAIKISGGNVFVSSSKTGIDTDKNLAISGGTVVVTASKAPFKYGESSTFAVSGNSATIFGLGSKKKTNEGLPTSCSIKCISQTFEESSSEPLGIDGVISIESPNAYKAALLISAKLNDDAEAENCFVQGHTLGSNGNVFISSDTSVLIAK